jgi:NADH:ubiquinone oxidoreductase subunit 6 (subunit J)
VEISVAVIGTGLSAVESEGPTLPGDFGSPAQIGEFMLEKFLVVFEAASMLLLIAAVGAVVLAGRKPRGDDHPGGGGREAEQPTGGGSA